MKQEQKKLSPRDLGIVSYTVEGILDEYHTRIEGMFDKKGVEPDNLKDRETLAMARSLEASHHWRQAGRKERSKIIDRLLELEDHREQLANTRDLAAETAKRKKG